MSVGDSRRIKEAGLVFYPLNLLRYNWVPNTMNISMLIYAFPPLDIIDYSYKFYESINVRAKRFSTKGIWDIYEKLDEKISKELVEIYGSKKIVDIIINNNIVDIRKLAALIYWLLEALELDIISIHLWYVDDKPFIVILYKNCDTASWEKHSKQIAEELTRAGFVDEAGKVILVCKEGLETLKG